MPSAPGLSLDFPGRAEDLPRFAALRTREYSVIPPRGPSLGATPSDLARTIRIPPRRACAMASHWQMPISTRSCCEAGSAASGKSAGIITYQQSVPVSAAQSGVEVAGIDKGVTMRPCRSGGHCNAIRFRAWPAR